MVSLPLMTLVTKMLMALTSLKIFTPWNLSQKILNFVDSQYKSIHLKHRNIKSFYIGPFI